MKEIIYLTDAHRAAAQKLVIPWDSDIPRWYVAEAFGEVCTATETEECENFLAPAGEIGTTWNLVSMEFFKEDTTFSSFKDEIQIVGKAILMNRAMGLAPDRTASFSGQYYAISPSREVWLVDMCFDHMSNSIGVTAVNGLSKTRTEMLLNNVDYYTAMGISRAEMIAEGANVFWGGVNGQRKR